MSTINISSTDKILKYSKSAYDLPIPKNETDGYQT